MHHRSHLGRLTAGLILIATLAMSVITAPQASAQTGATLEIHNRICPTEYAGGDLFGACHGTAPDPGLPFTLTGPETRDATTDGNGNIIFADLAAGTYTLSGGVPGEFASTQVYCSDAADVSVPYPFSGAPTGIAIDLTAGVSVVCDWYNIPIDLSGGEELSGVLELFTLRCDGEPGTVIQVFDPVEVAGGLAEGGADDSCRGNTGSFEIYLYGDQSSEPRSIDAKIGVNPVELPIGDHLIVDLQTGATATFPIEESATSRVYVLYLFAPDLSGIDPTPVPTQPTAPTAGGVTALPNTGAGPLPGNGSALLIVASMLAAAGLTALGAAARGRRAA